MDFWPTEVRDEGFLPSLACMQDDPLRLRCAYAALGTQLVSTWPMTRLAHVSFTLI